MAKKPHPYPNVPGKPKKDYQGRPIMFAWTDGACSGNGQKDAPGGWAFIVRVIYYEAENLERSKSGGMIGTTNNQMEMQAVYELLKYVKKAANLTIHCDSEYVCKAMTPDKKTGKRWIDTWRENGWRTAKREPVKNKELWQQILDIIEERGHSVKFIWVKGHDKDAMNNRVDAMAVEARKLIASKGA
jgi:ribonuclease HI